MIDAALERVPVEHRFTGLAILAVVVCLAVGYAARTFQAERTVTRTIQVVHAPASGAAVAAAWGKPDTVVPGDQINAQLAGTTCAVYRSRRAILCYA